MTFLEIVKAGGKKYDPKSSLNWEIIGNNWAQNREVDSETGESEPTKKRTTEFLFVERQVL